MKEITFNPIALIGDSVSVLNYRKRPAKWQFGIVRAVSFCQRFNRNSFHEHYEVEVENGSKKYKLTVGKNDIVKH